jgi:hypothetical protein
MEGLAQVCTQTPFKDGLCIDHYRLKKNHDHKFLNSDGQARLSNEKHCDQVNTKFMADKAYETTRDQMDDLKKQFIEMDEDGSGDINVLELGRAMEKLGKPKVRGWSAAEWGCRTAPQKGNIASFVAACCKPEPSPPFFSPRTSYNFAK